MPPEATSEEARCGETRTFDVFQKQGIDGIIDSSPIPHCGMLEER
jgi:hypothetical protein